LFFGREFFDLAIVVADFFGKIQKVFFTIIFRINNAANFFFFYQKSVFCFLFFLLTFNKVAKLRNL